MTEQDSYNSWILYVTNAFSANMLFANYHAAEVYFEKITEKEARKMLESKAFESAIGHESTAQILSERLGQEVKANRMPVSLQAGDQVLICQITFPGGRLPEGKVLTEQEVRRLPITYILARLAVTESRW
jgi:hypothetical protein